LENVQGVNEWGGSYFTRMNKMFPNHKYAGSVTDESFYDSNPTPEQLAWSKCQRGLTDFSDRIIKLYNENRLIYCKYIKKIISL